MTNGLKVGIRGQRSDVVTREKTAEVHGSGLLPVYATPFMIGLMEQTCSESVLPYMDDGKGTVGTKVDIRHLSATVVGMGVRCESELIEISGRQLTFSVKAYDDYGLIGEGLHERFVIDNERFMEKAVKKVNKN
ncbi:MAG: thioesterase family protein [Clostridia bacterium]|nr:thioesterase family protein [Clostridia bacterium]